MNVRVDTTYQCQFQEDKLTRKHVHLLSISPVFGEHENNAQKCNLQPLTHHFDIMKLGFTGVYICSYFCNKTLIMGTRGGSNSNNNNQYIEQNKKNPFFIRKVSFLQL